MLPASLAGRVFEAKTGGTINFSPNATVALVHPNVYLFSASKGALPNLKQTMCSGATQSYDACVQILDFKHLAHRIFHRGVVDELGGARMSHLFRTFESAEVIYDAMGRNRNSGRAPAASPFRKDIFFANQQEIRVVFSPFQPIPLPHFWFACPARTIFSKRFFAQRRTQ